MAVTYGFYNSVDGDRRYNAHDIGRLFDGLITDGVYLNVGDCFEVTQAGGMTVNVGVGRAWFHNTWLYNDAPLPITLDPADVLDRIDAIVIEVNTNDDVRRNDIKYIRGTPSSSAERPNLVKADKINQYALVYININGGATGITSNDILSVVGTEETPVVSGIVQPSGLFASKGEFESHLADGVHKVARGEWTDTSTVLQPSEVYTKTFPLGFEGVIGNFTIKPLGQNVGGLVFFTANPADARLLAGNLLYYYEDNPQGIFSIAMGSGINLQDAYLDGENLVLKFRNRMNDAVTLNGKLVWEARG